MLQVAGFDLVCLVMYICTSLLEYEMTRTQIYLDDELKNELQIQSKIQDKKISQIIREILREKLLKKERAPIPIDEIAGIWSDRDFDTDEYIRNLRKSDRLERLYGKDFTRQ